MGNRTKLAGALLVLATGPALGAEGFSWGGDFRFRIEGLNHIPTDRPFNAEIYQLFNRDRTRLWAKYGFTENIDILARLTNEFRFYDTNDGRQDPGTWEFLGEVTPDQFYLDARKLANGLIDTRLGRQDFVYGTGKILADGTPLDGSRTFFADGAKVTFNFQGHSLDLLGLYTAQQPQPVINNQDTNLIESDQWAAGLYGKYNRFEQVPFEYYWIYKHENDTATSYKEKGRYVLADANFSTFGFRVMPKFGYGLTGNLEVATQAGTHGEDDVNGTMVDTSLSFAPPGFLPDYKPLLKIGYWYLSGNEADSSSNEGWHPVYGRQPQDNWGELMGYTLIGSQYSIFGWSNFSTPFVALEASPIPKSRLILRYSWVGAAEDDGLGGGDGTDRGGLFFALFTFEIMPQLKGHLWGEWFNPGDYYADTARDNSFLRLNLEYSF
ncbi:MAG: hypothetical protein NHG36_18390 [Chromatiaceae bacterium]|nr:hypothetical protein [Candidatus Thioaporhodococcus sediminis]